MGQALKLNALSDALPSFPHQNFEVNGDVPSSGRSRDTAGAGSCTTFQEECTKLVTN